MKPSNFTDDKFLDNDSTTTNNETIIDDLVSLLYYKCDNISKYSFNNDSDNSTL